MSNLQAEAHLDLSQLAVDRSPKAVDAPQRYSFTRCFVPGGILVAFATLFAWATRDTFLPATSVTITPVIVSRVEIKEEGTPLFQAAGWIEPRPTAVVVSALSPGVIQELLVVEGQAVKKGEAVAKLIDADARIAVSNAEAMLQLRLAQQERAEASLRAARMALQEPSEPRAQYADAEASLAAAQLSLDNLPHKIEAARSRQHFAGESLRRKEQVGEAISGKVLREARAELAAATNELKELESREPTLRAECEALIRKRDALHQRLELMTDEHRAVQIGEADLAAAKAVSEQARLAVKAAGLTLERMTVRAPITGRVLSLNARPGQRLNGTSSLDEQGTSGVLSLYDPKSLQVRVDVRLEDVPRIQVGQDAIVETAAISQSIAGKVLWVTTRADVQKNTLQVKVGIDAPPEVIKPEMLAKVTFLAPADIGSVVEGEPQLRIFAPRALVTGDSVWVADLTSRVARRQSIEVGRPAVEDDLIEITRGLNPTDKLIVAGRESLTEGTRIRVSGVDSTQLPYFPTQATANSSQSIQR